MIKLIVDSGSSIKQEEKEKYQIDIIPLKVMLNGIDYEDGVNLDINLFYNELIKNKQFPKTSLPSINQYKDLVKEYTSQNDDVIILTISSNISGTYNSLRLAFEDNPKVRVVDSKLAVGGIRILVEEINKYRNKELDFVVDKINTLIPRIKVMAIPETLEYLHLGGRLKKTDFILGTVLKINPIIGFQDGSVTTFAKKRGIKGGMQYITSALDDLDCDLDYPIIASYTYDKTNLDTLVSLTPIKYINNISEYDNLSLSIAAHWGPNAFGYIFVSKK